MGPRRGTRVAAGRFFARTAVGLAGVTGVATVLGLISEPLRSGLRELPRFDYDTASRIDDALRERSGVLTAVVGSGQNGILWWLVTVGTVIMLIHRRFRLAAYVMVIGAGALALMPLVRVATAWLGRAGASVDGPSGPALNSIVFYGALLLVFGGSIPRRFRAVAGGIVVVLVVGIGAAAGGLAVDHLWDVAAGWILGAGWLGVTTVAFRRWRAETGQPRRPLIDGLEPEASSDLMPRITVPDEHRLRAAATLLMAWAVIVGLLYGGGRLVAARAPGFDEAIPRWFAGHRTHQLTVVSEFWSRVGSTHYILTVGLVIGPLAVTYAGRWRPAVFLVLTMFGELTLFLMIEAGVGRPRPLVTQMDGVLPTAAFPSGHTAATTCLYGALAVLVMSRTHPWWRWPLLLVAIVMPALVGLSRVYRGEHHPLDVAGGILLGVLWLAAVTRVVRPNADLRQAEAAVQEVRSTPV